MSFEKVIRQIYCQKYWLKNRLNESYKCYRVIVSVKVFVKKTSCWLIMLQSDGFILNGLFGVDDSFFVENSVTADSALDSIVSFEFGLFSTVSFTTNVCDVNEFVVVDFHFWIDVDYYYKVDLFDL